MEPVYKNRMRRTGRWLKTLDFYVYFFLSTISRIGSIRIPISASDLLPVLSFRRISSYYLSTISSCESVFGWWTKYKTIYRPTFSTGRWELRVNSESGRSNCIRNLLRVHRFIKLASIQRTRNKVLVACKTAIQFVHEGGKSEIYPKVFEIIFQWVVYIC